MNSESSGNDDKRSVRDRMFATPLPLTRSGYLVRSDKAVLFLKVVDALSRLLIGRRKQARTPHNPQRILVSNWAHIGDVLTSLPTLRVLHEIFPSAKIDLVVARGSRAVVEGSGLYDRLYCVDHFILNRSGSGRYSKIWTYLRDRKKFLAAASRESYELAIDLYPYFPPASPLFQRAGIPVRCGFTSGGFGPLLTHPVTWTYQNKPIGRHHRDLIAALWPDVGNSLSYSPPAYPLGRSCKLPDRLAPADPHYVIIHLGAGQSWKEWPESSWCRLIEMWGCEAPLLVFCGTGTREAERAGRVAKHALPGRTLLFVDRTWEEFAALVAGAAGMLCLESSACHLAAEFSVPTVAIYSGVNEFALWGPDNPNARIISAHTSCAPCHRGCDTVPCIREVSPAEVLAALRSVLKKDGSTIGADPIKPDTRRVAIEL